MEINVQSTLDSNNSIVYKSKIRKIYDSVVTWMSLIGSIWIFLMMLIIVYDVAMREIFNKTFTGTAEIVRNTIVIILFLQITHVLKVGRHIRSTIILDRLPQKGKVILQIFACLLGILLFSLMAYVSWNPAITALVENHYEGEGALRVPTFPARIAIVIGSVFMVIQFLVNMYDALRYGKTDD